MRYLFLALKFIGILPMIMQQLEKNKYLDILLVQENLKQ